MDGEWPARSADELIRTGLLDIGDGYRAKNDELSSTGLPFARAANLNDGFDFSGADRFPSDRLAVVGAKVSQPGDVAFTSKGTVGRFAYVSENVERFVYSPQLCYWRSRNQQRISSRYLYYAMSAPAFAAQIRSVSGQTDMAEYVSLSDQRRFTIVLPPTPVQEGIAELLGALDDKIELNRRTAETLEATARAQFKSWFVDFDPVRTKAEGLPDAIAALFPVRLTEDGLPEGWEATNDQLATVKRESVEPSEVDAGTPYVGLEHIDGRNLLLTRHGHASDVNSLKTRFARGDLLFGKLRPYFHKVVIAPFDGISSSDIIVFQPRKGVPLSFLALAFSESSFIDMASNASGGTRMPRADWGYMRLQPAVRPSIAVLGAFDAAASPALKRAEAMQAESRTLAALRDTLLPKLISGELRIRDVERAVAAA